MSIINTLRLQKLWEDAQRKPEWATTRLWEYLYKEEVFKGKMWSLASQQPPTDEEGDLRRVDLVPEHSNDDGAWARILFFEAKRADAGPSDLEAVEYQAFTACCAYLHYFRKQSVWAHTAFAGKSRLWAYRAGNDYLTPWVPTGDGIGAPDEYIEVHSSRGHLILDGLKYIRDHREPKSRIFDVASSPRPAHVSLPVGWHTTEVELVAGSSSSPGTQAFGNIQYTHTGASSSAYTQPLYQPSQKSGGMQQDYVMASTAAQTQPPLDSESCVQLTVKSMYQKEGRTFYRCSVPMGKDLEVAAGDWTPHNVAWKGQTWPCYAYTGKKSGIQYYTLALE